ncbi:MAG: ATP-binding cassette domain-containing protein [Candidatus Gracilibacteria bacterium]|nr:ATP-binding cassette domain-containing protein [Candidatus Gracilibacteria bacterium]MDD3120638.1 ATP-binding cassette domain-containing protein [Candidatus Gracilibacteria bacterium]
MKIQNVTIGYNNRDVLKDIDFNIKKGEFIFFIGDSGSGKTSLIKTIIGDLAPKRGNIIDDNGQNVYEYSKKNLNAYRRNVGVIFQDYKLLKSKTVRENVAFAMEVSGFDDNKIIQRVPEVLSQVGLITKKEVFIQTLSGGEAQRVAIARALIHDPDIIIGDEPTGNLDPKMAEEIMNILLELNKNGKTIIIATHDDKIVNKLKKRVITFKDGKVFSDIEGGTYNL